MSLYNLYTDEAVTASSQKYDFLLLFEEPLQTNSFTALCQEQVAQSGSLLLVETLNRIAPFAKAAPYAVAADDAKSVFLAGMEYGQSYELIGSALILGIYNPSPSIKSVEFAKELLALEDKIFEYLGQYSSKVLIFVAGFLLQASKRFEIILGGGVTLAKTLLIADKLRETVLMRPNAKNILYVSGDSQETRNELKSLFLHLSYEQKALYAEYDLSEIDEDVLDNVEIEKKEESAGVPALFFYANTCSISNKELLGEVALSYYLL